VDFAIELTAFEAANAARLALVVNNVQYDGKMEVTVGAQVHSVSNSNTIIPGYAGFAHGLGGGHETLPLEIPLVPGALVAGTNTISFRYVRQEAYAVNGFTNVDNRIDDASSGFRVIKVNFKNSVGEALLSDDRFAYEDPRTWTAPASVATNLSLAITNGWQLWRGTNPTTGLRFELFNPVGVGLTTTNIWASCSDCHTRTGLDLAKWHFSNKSIQFRSVFHGLSELEGDWITAYIRSLPVEYATNAYPWNPLFQPGPGLDSLPPSQWAAGAGWDAVITNQAQIVNAIWPGSYSNGTWNLSLITTNRIFGSNAYSIREIPSVYMYPNIFHWLPKAHPKDAYASMMLTNGGVANALTNMFTFLAQARAQAAATNYPLMLSAFRSLIGAFKDFRDSNTNHNDFDHTLREAQARYAVGIWGMMKALEITEEFQLYDGLAIDTCGPQAEFRNMLLLNDLPFPISPTFADLNRTVEPGNPGQEFGGNGIGNGEPFNFVWWSASWYDLQLRVSNGNGTNACGLNAGMPLDIPYFYASINATTRLSILNGIPLMGQQALSMLEVLRIYSHTGLSVSNNPNIGSFSPAIDRIDPIIGASGYDSEYNETNSWADILPARTKIMEVVLEAWWTMGLFSFPPSHYHTPYLAGQPDVYIAFVPTNYATITDATTEVEVGRQISLLSSAKFYGVRTNLTRQVVETNMVIWATNNNGTLTTSNWEAQWP
jgi:hypothetical protein